MRAGLGTWAESRCHIQYEEESQHGLSAWVWIGWLLDSCMCALHCVEKKAEAHRGGKADAKRHSEMNPQKETLCLARQG